MSSLFDTLVRNRRNHTPWSRMSAAAFMRETVWNGAPHGARKEAVPVTIKVVYRPEVASRMWYTVSWPSASGESLQVSAQELDLALWRAAEMEMSRRKRPDDEPPLSEPPADARVIGPG